MKTRKTTKPRRVYHKRIVIDVTGTSKAAINKVARAIHSTSTEETVGGCEKRTVQLTHESSDVKQIFYGNI